VVASASEVIGGPLGRYAVSLAKGWRYYGAVLAAASAVPMALGVLERAHCIDRGWSTPDQFWHACFSDLPATYKDAGLTAGVVSFLTGGAGSPNPPHPPLTGFVMSLLASLVPAGPIEDRMRFYFALWAVLGALLLALTTWWTTASVRRFPLRAAHVALSPVLVLTVLVAPDILGVALVAAALYCWSRQRLVLAGALLGLAVSARTYPLVILIALLLVSARAGRLIAWGKTAGAALVTFGGVMVAFGVLNPASAVASYRAWYGSGAGFGSPWLLPQLAGYPLPSRVVTILCVVGWLAAVATGAVVALSTPRRPGVAEVSLVMVGIVLATGTSFPVQSSLWLVPLVALVGLRWKDHLYWAATEALHFIAVWLYLAGVQVPDRGLPAGWYAFFLLLRLTGVGWLVHRTWQVARLRRLLIVDDPDPDPDRDEPDRDQLDRDERDPDQLAGPLAGAPDHLIVRFG
jgi:hypothetical protein